MMIPNVNWQKVNRQSCQLISDVTRMWMGMIFMKMKEATYVTDGKGNYYMVYDAEVVATLPNEKVGKHITRITNQYMRMSKSTDSFEITENGTLGIKVKNLYDGVFKAGMAFWFDNYI